MMKQLSIKSDSTYSFEFLLLVLKKLSKLSLGTERVEINSCVAGKKPYVAQFYGFSKTQSEIVNLS